MSMFQGIVRQFLFKLTRTRNQTILKLFWNYRAKDIHQTWGEDSSDYSTVEKVIEMTVPATILDIGCGSGRLFPVYEKMGIKKVVAQDIAASAVRLCKERFPNLNYDYETKDILKLEYPEQYFDLIISNRVLSAVLPERLESTLKHLSKLARNIYLNELSDSDDTGSVSSYWFKHDYSALSTRFGFEILQQGKISKQSWFLFGRK
ncbi:MAG: class I SAM-dependent methyltransferase [Candidatus Eisenbacteria bacterium]|nr:class I SAM-dependent methyltransferase [Candidatus Eisenbacteria bacterium]